MGLGRTVERIGHYYPMCTYDYMTRMILRHVTTRRRSSNTPLMYDVSKCILLSCITKLEQIFKKWCKLNGQLLGTFQPSTAITAESCAGEGSSPIAFWARGQ